MVRADILQPVFVDHNALIILESHRGICRFLIESSSIEVQVPSGGELIGGGESGRKLIPQAVHIIIIVIGISTQSKGKYQPFGQQLLAYLSE